VTDGNVGVFRGNNRARMGRVGRFGDNDRVKMRHARVLEITVG
jgi:hypothetical protein